MQVEQHVVERDHALAALGRALGAGALVEQLPQQREAGVGQRPGGLRAQVQQALRHVEELVPRRHLLLLGGLGEAGGAEQLQPGRREVQRRQAVIGVQQLVPGGDGGLQAVFLVADRAEGAQRAAQQVFDGGALGVPQRSRDGVGLGQRLGRQRARGVEVVRPRGARERLGEMALEQRGEALGRVLARHQVRRKARVEVVGRDAAAPEVVGGFRHAVGVVAHQLHGQRHLRSEGRVGQGALAEAVDREDGGLVEGGQRRLEALHHLVVLAPVALAQRVQQSFDELVAAGRRLARLLGVQPRQRVDDALADALAQFGRGGVGEGDDEDALHLQPRLQQQAQVQAADVPGLAGAGGRLDLADAGELAVEDVEEFGAHSNPRQACSGPNTASALA